MNLTTIMIEQLYKNQQLLHIYTEDNVGSSFSSVIGRVIAYDEFDLVIQKYDNNGDCAGIRVVRIIDVEKIETDTEKLRYILKFTETNKDEKLIISKDGKIENVRHKILEYFKVYKKIVRIHIMGGFPPIIGIILEIGNNLLTIQQLDKEGEKLGIVFCYLGRMPIIEIEKIDTNMLELLRRWKPITKGKVIDTIRDVLTDLKENKKPAEFYSDGNKVVVGRVIAFDESDLLIERYDEYEQYDGIYLTDIASIQKVVVESKELQGFDNKDLINKSDWVVSLNNHSDELRRNLLLNIKNKEDVVVFCVDEEPIAGVLTGVGEDDMIIFDPCQKNHEKDGTILWWGTGDIIVDSKICKKYDSVKDNHVMADVIDMKKNCTFEDYITKLLESQRLIEICLVDNQNMDSYREVTGQLLAFDEYNIMMKAIDEDGTYDGIQVLPIEDLCYITLDCVYLKRVETLMLHSGKTMCNLPTIKNNENIKYNLLSQLKDKQEIIGLEKMNNNALVYGLVLEIEDGILKIEHIDENGTNKGCLLQDLEDVFYVYYDTKGCNRVKAALQKDLKMK